MLCRLNSLSSSVTIRASDKSIGTKVSSLEESCAFRFCGEYSKLLVNLSVVRVNKRFPRIDP